MCLPSARAPIFRHAYERYLYKRLAPGVLAELKVIPKKRIRTALEARSQGLSRNWLSEIARTSRRPGRVHEDPPRLFDFTDKMDQHDPRFGEQYRLPFPHEPDQDDGGDVMKDATNRGGVLIWTVDDLRRL